MGAEIYNRKFVIELGPTVGEMHVVFRVVNTISFFSDEIAVKIAPPPEDPVCNCGCELKEPVGTIVSNGKCSDTCLWTIHTDKPLKFNLTFESFNLEPEMQWLIIRDGFTREATLLVHTTGLGSQSETSPAPLMVRTNQVMIQLVTSAGYHGDGIKGGFRLHYSGKCKSFSSRSLFLIHVQERELFTT